GGDPSQISSRATQAGDQMCSGRTGNSIENNRNGAGCSLGRLSGWRVDREDHVHLERDEFLRQVGQSIKFALGGSPLNAEILALNPAALTQTLPKRFESRREVRGWAAGREHAQSRHLHGLLRLDRKWRGEEAASHGPEERAPLHHSIT